VEAPEEVRARATLDEMQSRISQGPYAALGVSEAASADQVRAAFLDLTKQFHPARFARMSPELHRLSNEVFIGIKTAHDALMRQLGSARAGASGAMPAVSADGTGRIPIQRPNLARGTDRPGTPPMVARTLTPTGSPTKIPTGQTPRVQTEPQRTPTGQVPRHPTDPVRPATNDPQRTPTGQIPRVQTEPIRGATTTPVPRGTSPGVGPSRTPPLGTPITRPTTPTTTRPATPPATRPATPPARPGSPPAPQQYNPDTVRHAGVPKDPPFDERAAHREALILLNDQSWAQARQVLQNLAARVPQSKSYRALLGYARGREAQVAGRAEDAALEYQRALQLEPDLAMAKAALAEVQRRR